VGRAGFILDNLIVAGKAKPMIVVMPDANITSILPRSNDDFARDFLEDVMPYVEANYRVQADRAHRALAGLSQGGIQTLIIGVPHLDKFAYLGVFSSGLLNMYGNELNGRYGMTGRLEPSEPNWEEEHKDMLNDAALKRGLKLFWIAIGKDDFLYPEHERTVALLRKHKFDVTVKVSDGNHSWINWRQYLAEFAPQLFR
jgi:enterochelin esterase family protein